MCGKPFNTEIYTWLKGLVCILIRNKVTAISNSFMADILTARVWLRTDDQP